MSTPTPAAPTIRLAEIIGSLSMATDLAMGQPLEFALRSCLLSVRIADLLGYDDALLRAVYYQSLLRYIGCNADTSTLTALVGDEIAIREGYATIDAARSAEVVGLLLRTIRQANGDASALDVAKAVARGLLSSGQVKEIFSGHCEVAQLLAAQLGFGDEITVALGQLYERWDGKGLPRGLKGDEISPAVLVVTFAQDMVTFDRLGGVEAARAIASRRRGSAYSPGIVDRFLERADELLAGIADEPPWREVLANEPGRPALLDDAQFESACLAIAHFADLKSNYFLGHSSGVADLVDRASLQLGFRAADRAHLRRAALIHDIGQVGVSTRIWDKSASLTEREWDQVRLHPYQTARVFARSSHLDAIGELASGHHERLDGSGYHRGVTATLLSPSVRLLAAAEAMRAMTEPRPHRPARDVDRAASELRNESRAGRLDPLSVDAVVSAAGARAVTALSSVDALTPREIEVLKLVARGRTMKEIGQELFISRKTVDNHVQHIYAKIGVSTRAGATLHALERGYFAVAEGPSQ